MSSTARPIKLTIAALGGQGGGVLSDWLVDVACRAGYLAQATSVPGVAQRTGATIYYLEFFPCSALPTDGRRPVLALMPHPGDVDVVVASEIMEAGRALQRGIVTADRTTLIASSHRDYAIGEKIHMSDGRADANRIAELARQHSKRFISFDMQTLAETHGSVISAVMLGALAGSGALPFQREAYCEAISAAGIAVKESLAAFAASADTAATSVSRSGAADRAASRSERVTRALPQSIAEQIERWVPASIRTTVREGARRLIDYQDVAYAALYLERLAQVLLHESQTGAEARLTEATARGLALWMSFEDTIRVADLKIRAARARRVLEDIRAKAGELVYVTEFVTPRVEELCGTLPVRVGEWVLASKSLSALLRRFVRGRQISTSRIAGYLMLFVLAHLRRWRRSMLRYAQEDARIRAWLTLIEEIARRDYDVAVEVAECQGLVKGYGDTHERGLRNYELISHRALQWAGNAGASGKLRELRAAALADDQGIALAQALEKVA